MSIPFPAEITHPILDASSDLLPWLTVQCQKEQHLASEAAAPPAPATLAALPAPVTLEEQGQQMVDVETDLFLGLPGTGRS